MHKLITASIFALAFALPATAQDAARMGTGILNEVKLSLIP